MPTVQELYDRYMAEHNPDGRTTISIFGYPSYQVLEAVQLWEKSKMNEQKNKMTRKEAEQKLVAIGTPKDFNGRYYILDALEALGLLKFEEAKELTVTIHGRETTLSYLIEIGRASGKFDLIPRK